MALEKLSYNSESFIHLITFDNDFEYIKMQVKDLKTRPMGCRGCTFMAGAVRKLQSLLETFDQSIPVRILTISDGEIHDSSETTTAGAGVASFVSQFNNRINSQAVRLFTSSSQPDTTGLNLKF